jgi:hypothetical protein
MKNAINFRFSLISPLFLNPKKAQTISKTTKTTIKGGMGCAPSSRSNSTNPPPSSCEKAHREVQPTPEETQTSPPQSGGCEDAPSDPPHRPQFADHESNPLRVPNPFASAVGDFYFVIPDMQLEAQQGSHSSSISSAAGGIHAASTNAVSPNELFSPCELTARYRQGNLSK